MRGVSCDAFERQNEEAYRGKRGAPVFEKAQMNRKTGCCRDRNSTLRNACLNHPEGCCYKSTKCALRNGFIWQIRRTAFPHYSRQILVKNDYVCNVFS